MIYLLKIFFEDKNSNRYRSHKDSLKLIFDVEEYKFEPGPMKYKELGEWICSRAAKYLDLKLEIYKTNGMNRWFMTGLEGNFNILKQITSETEKSCIIATHNNFLAEKMDKILLIENQNIKILK